MNFVMTRVNASLVVGLRPKVSSSSQSPAITEVTPSSIRAKASLRGRASNFFDSALLWYKAQKPSTLANGAAAGSLLLLLAVLKVEENAAALNGLSTALVDAAEEDEEVVSVVVAAADGRGFKVSSCVQSAMS